MPTMNNHACFAVTVTGIVQGVGFRPYVYRLAHELALSGWVLNSPAGVEMEIEGRAEDCAAFLARLKAQAPPISRVDTVRVSQKEPCGSCDFRILPSIEGPRRTLISPDLAICPDCLRELFDPRDRRYRYPFINCTNCGPRFTITFGLPYDRPLTTMKDFTMCAACAAEYADPRERRFHAQPNACPDCGPSLSFLNANGQALDGDPLLMARQALQEGRVVAVKGLGGYHLAADATQDAAVRELRERKLRWHKPFALMLPDLEQTRYYCQVSAEEETLLSGVERPIVLLKRHQDARGLSPAVALDEARLGVMLPYTPLHYLLIEGFSALVMTSANKSDEPIVYEDEAALTRLRGLADFYLTHNRPIFRRADDSVAVYAAGAPRLLRRGRGYAPQPLSLPGCEHRILAVGGQEKNAFCLIRGSEAFLSQHIGELDDAATYREFLREIEHFRAMFGIVPEAVACDSHPDYVASRYAENSGLPLIKVQHHHAHMASVLAEHNIEQAALGLIFDGAGYGEDGRLWGGEVLYGDCAAVTRLAHNRYLPLAGGETAVREPWRQAMAALADACGEGILQNPLWGWPAAWPLTLSALKQGVNAPLSSGMGRLFDAVAALAGLYHTVSFEGQAAMALERHIDESVDGAYRFALNEQAAGSLEIDWRPLIAAAAADMLAGQGAGAVAARFHRALAGLCLELARRFRKQYHTDIIALSGGCWQNIWLLTQVTDALHQDGFRVLANSAVPTNDGGLAFGQAAVASKLLKK